MPHPTITIEQVFGDGPFVEVGDPTAVDSSHHLVVVGGSLGQPQWHGRSVLKRSENSVGWYPIGVYTRGGLACLAVLTSRWPVNGLAIHPSEQFVVAATGSYDGGYFFEGELLLHDLKTGRTTSLLNSCRTVEEVTWLDAQTLRILLAPPTDEDVADWAAVEHQQIDLALTDWPAAPRRSIDVDTPATTRPFRRPRTTDDARRAVAGLASAQGLRWEVRRRVWALHPVDRGVVAGRDLAIERWDVRDTRQPRWRLDVDGTCTQLFADTDGRAVAAVSRAVSTTEDQHTEILRLDVDDGDSRVLSAPGLPVVLSRRADGRLLARPSGLRRAYGDPAVVMTGPGSESGDVRLGGYDLLNHFFDIRRSPEFLVLVGDEREPWRDKQVAEVRRSGTAWTTGRLFPLDWVGGRHLFGGPGVFLSEARHPGIVHAGAVHDGAGPQSGKAFVVRRRYPGGGLAWYVPLDDTVVAVDESDGVVVALTNLGRAVGIDAVTGALLWSVERLRVAGEPVVPLSLALESSTGAWIGTMDGRVLRATLPAG